MAQAGRAVSIPGVAFAGALLAPRDWIGSLVLLAMGQVVMFVLSRALAGGSRDSPDALGMVGFFLLLTLMFWSGQYLVYRVILKERPGRTSGALGAAMADFGRIAVASLAWLFMAVLVLAVFGVALLATPLGKAPGMSEWLEPLVAISVWSIMILLISFTAPAGFARRRWVVFVKLPAWADLWRILLAHGLVLLQVAGAWASLAGGTALVGAAVFRWSEETVGVLGLIAGGVALAATVQVTAAAWAQAWRQSLGRETLNPAAVFD